MYSSFQILRKYLSHLLTASNGQGHGIHSPFVFEFIRSVLNHQSLPPAGVAIEHERRKLLRNNNEISVDDFGAGSGSLKTSKRQIRAIAASSLKSKKFSQLLSRIVNKYKSQIILELGTSLGITASYLASAHERTVVYTIEGDKNIAAIAAQTIRNLELQNVQIKAGKFDEILPDLLDQLATIDLAFIDGNHQEIPTINYFNQIMRHAHDSTILIFDDIHWSKGMENAWEYIKQSQRVSLSIDLFFIGIVFLDPGILVPQHFKIRF